MLPVMMKTQHDLQTRLKPKFDAMTLDERVAFIKEHSIHLNQEINEALYELPYFKPWKNYEHMSEEEKADAMHKFKCEMVDAWHFFMNMMLAADMSAEQLFDMYMEKNKENHRRQDAGYTHDVSYRG